MASTDIPELTQMYASSFALPTAQAEGQAQDVHDRIAESNAKAAEAAAKARANAFKDAKNYTVQQRPDGGFGFYGPDGKEVTAATYANNTGQDLTKVLAGSVNPIDQRYIADHNDLADYLKAKSQSSFDNKAKATAEKYENLVKQQYGLDLHTLNPVQVTQALQQNYPTIYGGHEAGFSGGNLFLPTQGQVGREVGYQAPGSNLNQPQYGFYGNQQNKPRIPGL